MVRNTIYRMLLQFFNLVVPIIVGVYIARLFSLEAYGAFNSATADLSIFNIFACFGIYDFGIREIGKHQDDFIKKKEIASNLFVIGAFTNVVAMGAYLLYVSFGVVSNYKVLYYLMVVQGLANIFNVEWLNEGTENFKFITIKTIVIRSIYVISLFVLVNSSDDVTVYTLLLSLSLLANNLVSFIYVRQYISIRAKWKQIKGYLKPLFILMIIVNINYLYGQLDKVLISKVCGEVETSFFHIPHYIANTVFTLIASIIMVSVPRLAFYLQKKKEDAYGALLKQTTEQFFFYAIPVFMGMASIAYDIIYIYSPKYSAASSIFVVACVMKLIGSFELIFSNQVIYLKNRQNHLLIIIAVGGILNVLANIVLIFMGILSPLTSSIVTLLVEVVVVIGLGMYVKYGLKMKMDFVNRNILKYVVLCLPFFVISSALKLVVQNIIFHAMVCILVSAGYYLGVLFVIKDSNLSMLLEFIKKRLKLS